MTATEAATATLKRPRRALAIVVGVVFLDLVGFGVVIPILPFYVRSFGVSDVAIGLLAASYSFTQFLFAPILGRLSDGRGRRPVLLISLAGSVIAWTAFGVAAELVPSFGLLAGLAVLFGARMVAGAMGGNIATAQAYIADVTPADRRAGALGLIGASFSLGFIFGPAIGGFFASDRIVTAADTVLPSVVPATPFSLPSFVAAGLSLLAFVGAALFLPEPARTRGSVKRTTLVGSFVDALRNPSLRGLVVSFFVVSVAFSGVQVMFIPFVADVYGFDEPQAALLLTYVGVIGAVNQGVVVGRLARRFSPGRVAIAGASLLVVAIGSLPFSPAIGRALIPAPGGPAWLTPAVAGLVLVLGTLAFGNGLLNVSLATLVSTGASAETQGRAFGVTQSAGSLGRTVGPPVMAVLYVLAFWSPFVVGAVVLLPVLLLLARIARRSATSANSVAE